MHQAGRVRVAAVDEDLHRGRFAASSRSAKSAASTTTPLQPLRRPGRSSTCARWRATIDLEVARVAERRQQAVGLGRRLLDDHRQRHPPQVERDAVAEDEQQQQRQHAGDQEAARVAADLQQLLAHQADDAPQPGCAFAVSSRVMTPSVRRS